MTSWKSAVLCDSAAPAAALPTPLEAAEAAEPDVESAPAEFWLVEFEVAPEERAGLGSPALPERRMITASGLGNSNASPLPANSRSSAWSLVKLPCRPAERIPA